MALSDELTKLAARAKDAETRTAVARDEARGQLEQEVAAARATAEAEAQKMRQAAEEGKEEVSSHRKDLQQSWDAHVAQVRGNVEERKAQHDVQAADRRANMAEDYAEFAIDFAYSAVVEAEYASLDAVLARKEADQAAADTGAKA
jgi:hypothetical protein